MIEVKAIHRSELSYASPVVVVCKRDGTNRICVDYRRLNCITIPDPELITPMLEFVQKLGKSRYLDLSKGYWLIPVGEKDK